MNKSQVTNKEYNPENCVYIANMLQAQRYLLHLGAEYLYDVLWTSEKKKDSLVFVFPKCEETREAKRLWDAHEL